MRIQRIFGIVALALLLGPVHATAAGRTQVQVLEQSLDRTIVRVLASSDDVYASFALAISSPRLPVARILSEEQVAESALAAPGLQPGRERVTVTEPGLVRGIWTASVHVSLLANDGSGLRRTRSVTVQIDHPHSGPPLPAARVEGLEPPGAFLNSTVAARLASASLLARRAPAFVDDTFARSPNWMRIEVADGGIHVLDYATLRAAMGAAVDFVEPASLRLFSAGHRLQPRFPSGAGSSWEPSLGLREHAIRVEATNPTLVPGDRVIMLLAGIQGWTDEYDASAGWLDHEESTYAQSHAFWLTWDEAGMSGGDFAGPPLRMQVVDASPSGTPDRVLDNVRVRTHAEENIEMFFGTTPDDWSWTSDIERGVSRTHPFTTDGVVTDSTTWIRTRPGAEIAGAEVRPNSALRIFNAQYEISGTPVDSVQWSMTQQQSPDGYWFNFSYDGLSDGANTLRVRNTSALGWNGLSPRLFVDFFDLHWRANLTPDAQGHRDWVVPVYEASDGQWRFRMNDAAGRLDRAVILDSSVPFAPRWVEAGAGRLGPTALEFDYTVADSTQLAFRMSVASALRTPLRVEVRRPRLLRDEVRAPDFTAATGYDYLILAPAEFRSAAENLASMRRRDLLGNSGALVEVVHLQDVYDQFGHGAKDPAAIRNFIKFLFEVDPRLAFVTIVGDANRDSRAVIPGSTIDWCPTFVENAWPWHPDKGDSRNEGFVPFARDDWFVSLDDPIMYSSDFDLDLPDVAIGRLPVGSNSEAVRMVRMVEDYVLDPEAGPWKDTVLISADDEIGGFSDWEFQHVSQAERVSENLLPPALDKEKIYLTEYVNVGSSRSKPGARRDFIDAWSRGQLMVYYVGHGAPQQLADEVLFRIEDVASLRNGDRRPLFMGFSCDVGIFDDPTVQSMSEAMVLSPAGGAIATIAATYVTFVHVNEALTNAYCGRLYPSAPGSLTPRMTLGRSAAIGTALLESKIIGSGPPFNLPPSRSRKKNDAKYVILGDPATRLQSPDEDAQLTGEIVNRILTGQREELTATAPGIDSGAWDLVVSESVDSVRYFDPEGVRFLSYVLPGNKFFSGHGPFQGGQATAIFRTPAVMRLGEDGRLRMLLEGSGKSSVGLVDSLSVRKGSLEGDDREGPTIDFVDYAPGQALDPGQDLTVAIEDSSGVNVLGSVGANSILAEFDESGISVDFTDRFALDESSYSRGTVIVTLPDDLEVGSHTLTLSAGDMVGNVTLEKIEFQLSASVQNGITRHAPFPNPFGDSTRFVVEVNSSLPGTVELSLDLYTVGGAHVQSLDASINGSGRAILPWEGRDRRGDDLANGTYLYVVRARFGGSPPFTETATGRVVLMR